MKNGVKNKQTAGNNAARTVNSFSHLSFHYSSIAKIRLYTSSRPKLNFEGYMLLWLIIKHCTLCSSNQLLKLYNQIILLFTYFKLQVCFDNYSVPRFVLILFCWEMRKMSGYCILFFEHNNCFALQVKKVLKCIRNSNYFTYILGIS